VERLEVAARSVAVVVVDGRLEGCFGVADPLKPTSAAAVAALGRLGLQVLMLSGDARRTAEVVAAQVGIERVIAEVRPADKSSVIRKLQEQGEGPVAMVGDGINDAPALAAADLGIAVGTGTQIAQDSAAVVVMGDRLMDVVKALTLARRTMEKVRQNLIWAFGYNLIVIPLAAGALLPAFALRLTPSLAALLMALSSITVVVNALLLQRATDPSSSAPSHGH
jgi:Cu+-exporting ATPase